MRTFFRGLLIWAALCSPAFCMITITSGNLQTPGTSIVPNGSVSFQLNVDATIIKAPGGQVLSSIPVSCNFDNTGNISGTCTLWSNAELNPQNSQGLGTWYTVAYYDSNGNRVSQPGLIYQFPQAAGTVVPLTSMIATAASSIYYPISPVLGLGNSTNICDIAGFSAYTEFGAAVNACIAQVGLAGTVLITKTPASYASGWITSVQMNANYQTLFWYDGTYPCNYTGGGVGAPCVNGAAYGSNVTGQSRRGVVIQIAQAGPKGVEIGCEGSGTHFTVDGLNVATGDLLVAAGGTATVPCVNGRIEDTQVQNGNGVYAFNAETYTENWQIIHNYFYNSLGVLIGTLGNGQLFYGNVSWWMQANGVDSGGCNGCKINRNDTEFNGRNVSTFGSAQISAVARNGSNVATFTIARTNGDLPNTVSPAGVYIPQGVQLTMPPSFSNGSTLTITGLSTASFTGTISCTISSQTVSTFSCSNSGSTVATTPDYGIATTGCVTAGQLDQNGILSYSGPGVGAGLGGVQILDNISKYNTCSGVQVLAGSTGGIQGNVVANDVSYNGRSGVSVGATSGATTTQVLVSSNTALANTYYGIEGFSGTSNPFTISIGQNYVSGNLVAPTYFDGNGYASGPGLGMAGGQGGQVVTGGTAIEVQNAMFTNGIEGWINQFGMTLATTTASPQYTNGNALQLTTIAQNAAAFSARAYTVQQSDILWFAAYLKSDGTFQVAAELQAYDGGGNVLGNICSLDNSTSSTWTFYSATCNTPSNAAYVKMFIIRTDATGGSHSAYVTDIKLQNISNGSLVDGSSTQYGVAYGGGCCAVFGYTTVGATGTVLAGNTGAAPTYKAIGQFFQNQISGNVTLGTSSYTASSGTFPAVTTGGAATWHVIASVNLQTTSVTASTNFTCQLYDGTTVLAQAYWDTGTLASATVQGNQLTLSAVVTEAGAVTFTARCTSTTASQLMLAAAPNNSGGNLSSTIDAIRIQ